MPVATCSRPKRIAAGYPRAASKRVATAPTVLSKATFRAAVKPRTRLRVSITAVQAGTCYRPALSNVVLA